MTTEQKRERHKLPGGGVAAAGIFSAITSVVDPDGNTTIMEYEPNFNRLVKTTNALNQATTFTYDSLSHRPPNFAFVS